MDKYNVSHPIEIIIIHHTATSRCSLVQPPVVQGGDIVHGNGRGGESIYGGFFDDEGDDP